MLERIKPYLPIGYLNYYRFFKNMLAENPFGGKALAGVFEHIYQSNYWKGRDSVSGPTSGAAETTWLRPELQRLLQELQVRSILDIPCGDFIWMNEMNLTGIEYLGADIVPQLVAENQCRYANENRRFTTLDLTASELPKADLIICRDCLVHLSFEHIQQAITRIKQSGSTWLLSTSFIKNQFNYDISNGLWRTINLQKPPFNFPKPARILKDNQLLQDSVFRDKALCLWRIADL